jgi:hypothetical protein
VAPTVVVDGPVVVTTAVVWIEDWFPVSVELVDDPVDSSDSSSESLASADATASLAEATSWARVVGSSVATTSPGVTVCPTATLTADTVPEV